MSSLQVRFVYLIFTDFFFIFSYSHTFLCPGEDVCRRSVVFEFAGTYPLRYDSVPVPPVDQSQPHISVVT
jgi:hypothetical protein